MSMSQWCHRPCLVLVSWPAIHGCAVDGAIVRHRINALVRWENLAPYVKLQTSALVRNKLPRWCVVDMDSVFPMAHAPVRMDILDRNVNPSIVLVWKEIRQGWFVVEMEHVSHPIIVLVFQDTMEKLVHNSIVLDWKRMTRGFVHDRAHVSSQIHVPV